MIKKEPKPQISVNHQAFNENSSKTNYLLPFGIARGARFERLVERASLSERVYNFLISNGPVTLRGVYEALDEDPSNVGCCLRRLWKKELILRTRAPTFEFGKVLAKQVF